MTRSRLRVGRLLAGMRIRKKLVFLHTCFSLVLAGMLALALRPAVREVVEQAEIHEAGALAQFLVSRLAVGADTDFQVPPGVEWRVGDAASTGLSPEDAARVQAEGTEGGVVTLTDDPGAAPASRVAAFDPASRRYAVVGVRLESARRAVVRLYFAMTLALLAVYALVAVALEVFVLPEHVYEPIRRLLAADLAVQEGRRDEELIPERAIPRDELGEIMRSRNDSISTMRRHERDLAAALGRLEEVATDLKRKNYLLEAARRNLADADRLASLGVMSAGLAHEMNTPLAVLKGMVEKLQRSGAAPGPLSPAEAQLMSRVVGRLEDLSASLLDFARVRPAQTRPADVRAMVEEAWTLVSLDREARAVRFENRVAEGMTLECDPDRIVQVLVNLLRNAADALIEDPGARSNPARVEVAAQASVRDGREWMTITIADNGPGIDPEVLPRLFEPFASTRLDSRGTGLGLAVSEGIVSEHAGLLLARNRRDGAGAIFEIVLPVRRDDARPTSAHGAKTAHAE